MQLSYLLNKEKYKVFFSKTIDKKIALEVEKLNSDKKVILVYDYNIKKKLVDKLIYQLKKAGCKIIILRFKGNKKNKNEKMLFSLINHMIQNKLTKKSVLISFGGGVLGDLSALASSLYYRGLIYFHVPSTMTAIVDSCIGGKTAINYKNIINAIGNYYHAKAVFIYHEIISNLPEREYKSGIPEIIKCGLIKKNKILDILNKHENKIKKRDYNIIKKLCIETLKTKIFFFKNDIYEKKERLYLNFGHTFAHALEMFCETKINKEVYRHGEAVGIGMLCEIFLSNGKKNKVYVILENLLRKYQLPSKIEINKKRNFIIDEIYKNVFLDKKKISKLPRYIELKSLYKPKTQEINNNSEISMTLNHLI